MVEHHLPDELLLEYATGAGDPGYALIVACHLTLCPRCREVVAEYEDIGAALLGLDDASGLDDTPNPLPADGDLATRIFAGLEPELAAAPRATSADPVPSGDSIFPWPLQRVLAPYEDLAWRRRLPGLRTFDVNIPGSETHIRMVEAKADMTVVVHGHHGLELDLVLAGGLHDRTRGGEYERGDIQCSTAEVTHELGVLPGGPCVLLTINEGPFVPSGLVSRLVYGYLGWS